MLDKKFTLGKKTVLILLYKGYNFLYFWLLFEGLWIGGRYRTLAMTYNWESTGGIISPDVLDWEQPNYPMMNECLLIYLANANRKRDLPCTEMQGLICERRKFVQKVQLGRVSIYKSLSKKQNSIFAGHKGFIKH